MESNDDHTARVAHIRKLALCDIRRIAREQGLTEIAGIANMALVGPDTYRKVNDEDDRSDRHGVEDEGIRNP